MLGRFPLFLTQIFLVHTYKMVGSERSGTTASSSSTTTCDRCRFCVVLRDVQEIANSGILVWAERINAPRNADPPDGQCRVGHMCAGHSFWLCSTSSTYPRLSPAYPRGVCLGTTQIPRTKHTQWCARITYCFIVPGCARPYLCPCLQFLSSMLTILRTIETSLVGIERSTAGVLDPCFDFDFAVDGSGRRG